MDLRKKKIETKKRKIESDKLIIASTLNCNYNLY